MMNSIPVYMGWAVPRFARGVRQNPSSSLTHMITVHPSELTMAGLYIGLPQLVESSCGSMREQAPAQGDRPRRSL